MSQSNQAPRPSADPGTLLPRSASLALWARATSPDAPVRPAVRAVVGDDEPHAVSGPPADALGVTDLEHLLEAWAGRVVASAALFPGPGDAMGVPAEVSADAVEAEECVLVTLRPSGGRAAAEQGDDGGADLEHWALVPDVQEFGSEWEPGHLVVWRTARVADWSYRTLGTVGSLADAERALVKGLRDATAALVSLDVPRWREDAGEAIANLRQTVDLRHLLPPGDDPRRSQVFQSAARLRAIVDLAGVDDGGAVNLWQADQRSTALREIDRVARRAMAAATVVLPGAR
ncbi:hypothetical protein [Sanguibacter suaedae]|uniref:Uncharacterized protein n=1 Tax=Sanguibacter suaedae TaxID=2795737 RepID=A0A934IA55_9MICO|nr:hypothetical protein [Sanguibacter suaedae]MBI9114995.1 hypothetical protein [Sanguibacter suaedae]